VIRERATLTRIGQSPESVRSSYAKSVKRGGIRQSKIGTRKSPKIPLVIGHFSAILIVLFMKTEIHPRYMDAEIRCACGNIIKTRSTKQTIIVGICNVCHPFYTGQQKFVDTAGRVDKFQQRAAKTQAAQEAFATKKKKKG
jgi:large subunit ribosomal protein L31